MSAHAGQAPFSRETAEPADARRLRLLEATDESLTDTDALLAALQHAVAGLGGLGGMAHLSGRRATRALTLVVSSGLPRGFTRPWESVSGDAAVAPACAIRDELPVWLPPPSTDAHSAGQQQANGAFPADTGMVAVPLPDPDGPLGALSVLVDTPGGPDPARLAFLEKVARWAAGRLHRNVPVSQDTSLTCREAFDAVKVGAWDWDLHTGARLVAGGSRPVPEGHTRRKEGARTRGAMSPGRCQWLAVGVRPPVAGQRPLVPLAAGARAERTDGLLHRHHRQAPA